MKIKVGKHVTDNMRWEALPFRLPVTVIGEQIYAQASIRIRLIYEGSDAFEKFHFQQGNWYFFKDTVLLIKKNISLHFVNLSMIQTDK